MKATAETTTAGAKRPGKTDRNLSPDGKWRSFPRVPNLVQYVRTGTYFGRTKVGGKQIRQSLETVVFTVAKDRLPDFMKKHQRRRHVSGTAGEAREAYEARIESDHVLADATKRYYRECIKRLFATWPGLEKAKLARITEADCQSWAKGFSERYDARFYNNTLAILRRLFALGGYAGVDNPAMKISRLGVRSKELHLPSLDQFNQIVEEIRTAGARQSRDCANFVRFLAFSGCRVSEAWAVMWGDVNLEAGTIRVTNAKTRRKGSGRDHRFVPIIPPMRELLESMRPETAQPSDPVCRVGECQKALDRACKRVGVARLVHHDLRHLFATRCIESGVDIPTVSRWLGHHDGGVLAMQTYGHLRDEHSAQAAQKVTFTNGGDR